MHPVKVTRLAAKEVPPVRDDISCEPIDTIGVDDNGRVWIRVTGGALSIEQRGGLTVWSHRELEANTQEVEVKPNMSIEIIVRE